MIIVDDEYIISEGLKTMVDWASVGVEVVGVAENGAAALELALKRQPDIILSDIAMPHFSGLQMIETLRRNGLDTEVIFISAYSRFDYAKEALRYGAFDYILKPIQETLLLETVRRCVEKIHSKQTQAVDHDATLAKLLVGGKPDREGAALWLEMVAELTREATHAMAIGLWGSQPEALVSAMRFEGPSIHRAAPLKGRDDVTVLLLLGDAHAFSDMPQQWRQPLSDSLSDIRVTASDPFPLETAMEYLFSQICFGQITASVKGLSWVAFSDHARLAGEAFPNFEQGRAALLELVKTARKEQVESALYRFFLTMRESDLIYDMALVRLHCIDSVNRILHDPSVYHLQAYFGSQINTLTAQKSIAICETLEEAFFATKNLLVNFAASVQEIQKKSTKRLVNLAVQYIEENYGSDMSLSQAAQTLFVSASYLSKVFSTEMQTTFSHFLQTHRVETAKNLLRSTNLKIYEIANRVGYGDVVHFSKSFKQITGLSPNQYRNQ